MGPKRHPSTADRNSSGSISPQIQSSRQSSSPATVAYPESYPNEVHFDEKGYAYIADWSADRPNAIIVVNLETSESWRYLDGHPSVRPETPFSLSAWGEDVYEGGSSGDPSTYLATGSDGIAISSDGETQYYCPISRRNLYSIPTAWLRDNGPSSLILASASVNTLTEEGVSDGLKSDSNGLVYGGSFETNSIFADNPHNGTVSTYVRGPEIECFDTFAVIEDWLYWTSDQLWRRPGSNGGVNGRIGPYSLSRVRTAWVGGRLGRKRAFPL